METSFQEFLRQKMEGSDWKGRKHLRSEWLGALHRLITQIQTWLGESDPEGVLECVAYEVQCVEARLGVYNAPALKIRLETEYADVLPTGRFVSLPYPVQQMLAVEENRRYWGNLTGGQVVITNGERKHILLRSTWGPDEVWKVLRMDQVGPVDFTKAVLEEILEDLLK